MKVPKMYKSSDLYDAGTDVIYNDDSKLQYAPFIYATTGSGDGGDDEEGEDIMLVNYDEDNGTIDKTFNELKTAATTGKVAVISIPTPNGGVGVYYLNIVDSVLEFGYCAYFTNVYPDSTDNNSPTLDMISFKSDTNDGVMTQFDGR